MPVWTRIDADIERNRKTLDLRARLSWSANDCLARLVRLFSAVREQAPAGDLTDWSAAQIALAMEPEGGLEAEPLLAALLATGFLTQLEGRLVLKGWAERNGDWLKANNRSEQRS